LPVPVLNHSYRTYVFGRALGEREAQTSTPSCEYAGALLHVGDAVAGVCGVEKLLELRTTASTPLEFQRSRRCLTFATSPVGGDVTSGDAVQATGDQVGRGGCLTDWLYRTWVLMYDWRNRHTKT
jgi:hypothetical protein